MIKSERVSSLFSYLQKMRQQLAAGGKKSAGLSTSLMIPLMWMKDRLCAVVQ